MLDVFGPEGAVQIARLVGMEQACEGPCETGMIGHRSTFAASATVSSTKSRSDEGPPAVFSSNGGHPDFGLMLVPLMMVALMIIIPLQKLRPEWFRWLTHPGGVPDVVRPIPDPSRDRRPLPPVSITPPLARPPGNLDSVPRPAAPVRGFGRKVV